MLEDKYINKSTEAGLYMGCKYIVKTIKEGSKDLIDLYLEWSKNISNDINDIRLWLSFINSAEGMMWLSILLILCTVGSIMVFGSLIKYPVIIKAKITIDKNTTATFKTSQSNFTKLKLGSRAIIELERYPSNEYGTLHGKLTPSQKVFITTVLLLGKYVWISSAWKNSRRKLK